MNTITIEQPSLTIEEKEFLDKNGYILLENVLSPEQIKTIKKRIEEVKAEEGERVGEVRYLEYRNYLKNKGGIKSKVILSLNTFIFRFMKFIMIPLRSRFKWINQVFYHIISGQTFYQNNLSFRGDIEQMFLNITQQQETKVDRLCNLVNKGEEFEVFFTHPKVLDAVKYIIGDDFKLSSLNMRAPKKGCWVQPLHADWPWPVKPGRFYTSNTLWMLDDIDENNGPTRVIPGTHVTGKLPSSEIKDLQVPLSDEIHVTGKAGSVLILNGHVWHGGTTNHSGKSRQLIQSYYVHGAHPPQQYQHLLITEDNRAKFDKKKLEILDIY